MNFVDRIAAATLEWAQGVDFEPILTAFKNLLKAIEPVVDIILDNLAWAYENILLPLATWVIEEAGPAAVDVLTAAFRILGEVLEAFQESGRWLWENFLEPIAKWTGGIIVAVLENLAEGLNKVSDWMINNKEVVNAIALIVSSFAAAWVLVNGAIAIWNGIATIAATVTTAFGAAVAFLTSPIGIIVVAIGALIAIVALLVKDWDKIKAAAGAAWDFIVSTWQAAGEWITTNVLDPVVNAFKTAINFINGIVEGFVNFFIGGINAIINGLNCISFDVPDWVPLIGGNTFGFNIPNVPELKIPRLARGAVIPPNREFMAVLGDQKSGTNYEVPDAKLRQLIREEMGGARNGPQEIKLVVTAGGGLVRELKFELDRETQRQGVRMVKGGAY